MQLEDNEDAEMDVVEVDDALAIMTCKRYNYKYAVVTANDIVIPPRLDDNLPEDQIQKLFEFWEPIYGNKLSETSY